MTFEHLRENNVNRVNQFLHNIDNWHLVDWSNAMAGECGEACNITKKIRRLENLAAGEMKGQMNKEEDQNVGILVGRLAEEIADVVIYADLLLAKVGISLDDAIRSKFNKTSHQHEIRNKIPHMTLPRL